MMRTLAAVIAFVAACSFAAVAQQLFPPIGPGSLVPIGPSTTSAGSSPPPDNPAVDLNFAANTATGCSTLTSCLSVTRTTQETCEPAGGIITYATAGNPCISAAGLQVYGAVTNVIPQSQATTGWTTSNVTFTSAAAGTAPDGVASALVMTDNVTSGVHQIAAPNATPSVGTYTGGLFAKAGTCAGATHECDYIGVNLWNNDTGTAALFVDVDLRTCAIVGGTAAVQQWRVTSFSNGWCKIAFTGATTATTSTQPISIAMLTEIPSGGNKSQTYSGSGSTVFVWGVQVALTGAFRPYCPTAGASATCNADQITDGGADTTLKTNLEGAALRAVMKIANNGQAQNAAGTYLGVGTTLTGLGIDTGSRATSNWPTTATLASAGLFLPQAIINSPLTNWIGISANASGRSLALNGQTVVSDSNGLSASTLEYIGEKSDGSATCDCTIAEVKIWNSRNDANMLTATANTNALPLVASYTGTVANRASPPNSIIAPATATQAMTRSHHRASDNITSLQARFTNYYVQNNSTETEIGSGGTTTITASVEYPSGSCTPFTFSSVSSGSISNISTLLTDALTIAIPSGADFWIRDYKTNASGITVVTNTGGVGAKADTVNGDATTFGTSGVVDQTTTCGAVTNTNANVYDTPDAIVGPTQRQAYCLIGDSRGEAYQDTFSDAADNTGELTRWLSPYYNTLNMDVGGDQANKFVASHANRLPLLAYCTGLFVQLTVNDVYVGSRTAVQIEADLQTIFGYVSNLHGGTGPVWMTTTPNETTSSDNWATVVNQTASAAGSGSGVIDTVNLWKRANTAGITGFFENQTVVQTAATGAVFNANGLAQGWTKDGVHEVQLAYMSIMNARGFQKLQ